MAFLLITVILLVYWYEQEKQYQRDTKHVKWAHKWHSKISIRSPCDLIDPFD